MNLQTPTTMNSAVLNWCTPDADTFIAYLARQSSPKNQELTRRLLAGLEETPDSTPLYLDIQKELSELTEDLLSSCMDNGHWSVLEQASMSVTVLTSRAISAQMIRHHSLRFQEFSQRYAAVTRDISAPELRFVDGAKRNPSVSSDNALLPKVLQERLEGFLGDTKGLYDELLAIGVHPESARFYLPMVTPTTLSVSGNLRDWLFAIKSRTSVHAQAEIQLVFQDIKHIFRDVAPITYNAAVSSGIF